LQKFRKLFIVGGEGSEGGENNQGGEAVEGKFFWLNLGNQCAKETTLWTKNSREERGGRGEGRPSKNTGRGAFE